MNAAKVFGWCDRKEQEFPETKDHREVLRGSKNPARILLREGDDEGRLHNQIKHKNMEQHTLFPLKYRLRKTDEPVEIVAWETAEKGARSESDWVSYIDADGNEHIKEHLTLEWDFVIDSPLDKMLSGGWGSLEKLDPWEARRYELAKEFVLKGLAKSAHGAVAMADKLIAELKPSCPEPPGAVCAE